MAFDLTAALIDLPYPIYNTICWFTTILCTILTILGGTYHIYKTQHWLIADKMSNQMCTSPRSSRRRSNNYLSVYLSFFMIVEAFAFMLVTLHMTYTESFPMSFTQCHIVKYTATIFYTSFKAILYTILVLRLWQTFSDKIIVNYSQKWLCCWVLTVYAWTLMTNIINVLTTRIVINERGSCDNEWSVLFLISVATLDILAAVLYSYLFAKPILILIHSKEANIATLKLKLTAMKQCVLSMAASGSTLIGAMFVVTFGMTQTFACLDVVISSFSVILMYKWHRKIWLALGCGTCVRRFILNVKEREILLQRELRGETIRSVTDSTKEMSGHSGTTTSSNGLSLEPAVSLEDTAPTPALPPLTPRNTCPEMGRIPERSENASIDIIVVGDDGKVGDLKLSGSAAD